MRKIILPLIMVGLVALGGCSGMSDTEQRTLSGTGIGAAGGVAIGALTGHTLTGAAIGTAAGAASGFLYDRHKKHQEQ
jgi:osmotically inducible lipoprotein OsmB